MPEHWGLHVFSVSVLVVVALIIWVNTTQSGKKKRNGDNGHK